jgi:pimeloyl-ACP methyl ester carboxylesterase
MAIAPSRIECELVSIKKRAKYHIKDSFMHSAVVKLARIEYAKIFSINTAIFSEKSGPPAWSQHPTWYQVSDNDKSIPPDIERMFAKQMNATTVSLPASHVSYISHPNEVADFILNATKGK